MEHLILRETPMFIILLFTLGSLIPERDLTSVKGHCEAFLSERTIYHLNIRHFAYKW